MDVKSFQDQNSKTVSVNVSWTPGYSGGYDQEFTIHYRVKQSNRDFVEQFVGHPDNNMHTIPGLYPETVYEFTVQASNKLGQSQPSDPKEYKTAGNKKKYMKKVNHRMFGNVMKYYVMAMTAVLIVLRLFVFRVPDTSGQRNWYVWKIF